ncbi:hypothetical protein UPYG_G00235660 [Umbra pygmaea]|uniref:THAP-type domain-containing protein n=1 Tax=Umbra pygmaea TaxID=75934 RepID=A0ABD0WE93_UMBPY
MSKHHGKCSVVGCKDEHKTLHRVPAAEDRRATWIEFIFDGNVPATVGKKHLVCANHFEADCFSNFDEGHASASLELPTTKDIGCQTEPPQRQNVGTQLYSRTLRSHDKSKAVQATVSCMDFGTSTDPFIAPHLSSTPIKRPSKRPRLEEEDPFEGSSTTTSQGLDTTYRPADSVSTLTESTVMLDAAFTSTQAIRKYIVYETCLMELFEVCAMCKRACNIKTKSLGTFLSVEQLCKHLYISGASFFKLQRVFKAMRLQIFLYDTFRRHARMFVEPAVVHAWKNSQEVMLQQLSQDKKLILCGDMRADSPGHCAKYGSYTMMDLNTNTIVDLQLVQSNEVGGSSYMEKEGLKRSLSLLGARGLTIDCIVTDRHPQIQKFLKEENVTQFYDVWHTEKRLAKKIDKLAKKRTVKK